MRLPLGFSLRASGGADHITLLSRVALHGKIHVYMTRKELPAERHGCAI